MTPIPSAQLGMGKELGSPRPGSEKDNWDLFKLAQKPLGSLTPGLTIPCPVGAPRVSHLPARSHIPCALQTQEYKRAGKIPPWRVCEQRIHNLIIHTPHANLARTGKRSFLKTFQSSAEIAQIPLIQAERDFLSAELCSRQAEFSGKNNDEIL